MKVIGIITSLLLALNVVFATIETSCHIEETSNNVSLTPCDESADADNKEHDTDINHCKMHCLHHASYFVNTVDIQFISLNPVLKSDYSFLLVKTYLEKPLRPPLV